MIGSGSYDDKEEFRLNQKDADELNNFLSYATEAEKHKLWKLFWGDTVGGKNQGVEYAKAENTKKGSRVGPQITVNPNWRGAPGTTSISS